MSQPRATLLQRRYVAYYFFANTVLHVPILLVHFEASGLTTAQALYLVSVYLTAIAVSEIPLGVFADAIGLRATLLASLGCAAAGTALFATASSYWAFAIGQIAVALCMSLSSGTSSAYLYELCRDADVDYAALEGRATSARFIALAGASLLGGIAYSLWPVMPFLLTLLFTFVSLAFLLHLPSEPRTRKYTWLGSFNDTLRFTARSLVFQPKLAALIAHSSIFFAFTGLVYWFSQPYMGSRGIPATWFGVVYMAFPLSAGLGSRLFPHTNRRIGYLGSIVLLGLLLGISIGVLGVANAPWGLLVLLGARLLNGYAIPMYRALLQDQTPAGARATILSIQSMMHRLTLAAVSGLLGLVLAQNNFTTILVWLGLSVLILLPTLGVLVLTRIKKAIPTH